MLERTQMRMLPLVNRAAEHAPVLPACCNACRTCTTTNILGLVTGGAFAAAYAVAGVARRFRRRPAPLV